MTGWSLLHRRDLGPELVLAFVSGVAAFVLAAVISNAARGHISVAPLGLLFLLAVLAVTHYGGILYALPVGVAGIEALDWYFVPPLRALDSATVALLGLVLGVAVLIGAVTSRTSRRADASEGARGVLADEQAALRRVATLVARGVPPSEVFQAVAAEVGGLLGADLAGMIRYEDDDAVCAVAAWAAEGEHPEVGGTWPLEGENLGVTIARTGRPGRIDSYERVRGSIAAFVRDELGVGSSVGSPIVVEGRLWGALVVHSKQADPLPADTEVRLKNFIELVATAISNAEARADVQRLADEQAALRRVATLVAREAPPAEIFAAVADELARVVSVLEATMWRYEEDGSATAVAARGEHVGPVSVGARVDLNGENVAARVLRTGRPARIDDYAAATGPLAECFRSFGIRSAVGCPIDVHGRLWGVMIIASRRAVPLPQDTEAHIERFTDLVTTAIANGQARAELAASRARIVAAADDERRRVVRDLHDGAQQRLVHTVITLKMARDALGRGDDPARRLVSDALAHAEQANAEVRELAHGILPTVLTHGGLRAGVDALASRTPVPVDNHVSVDRRLAPAVEATAYFVVAEALTNVAKHSHAHHAAVRAAIADDALRVDVRDDGVGGARPEGSGLLGLADRLAALDGSLRVESPPEGGTVVAATIPLAPGGNGHAREDQPSHSVWDSAPRMPSDR